MSVCSFNPYDSDTYPEPDIQIFNGEINEEENNGNNIQFTNDESSSSNEEVVVLSDPADPSIHMTNLENLRAVLSIITRFPGGVLSNFLKNFGGLIILPLSAVSMIRKPSSNHNNNPPAFVYYPENGPNSAPHMNQLNEVMRLIYSVPQ